MIHVGEKMDCILSWRGLTTLSEVEELVTLKIFSFVTGLLVGSSGMGGTRDNERASSLRAFLSPESPNMKNFRNAQRMIITESCPNWILTQNQKKWIPETPE